MKLSLSEEAYSKAFYKAYNRYGNDIPDAEWQRLGELRARYGIEMSRVRKIINAVQEGTIEPDIEHKKTTTDKPKPASVVSILTDTARGMKNRDNGTDCLLLDISDTIKSSIRSNFDLGLDEQILWVRDTSFWGNKNQGLVITDKQIVYIPDNDSQIANIISSSTTSTKWNIARWLSLFGITKTSISDFLLEHFLNTQKNHKV